MIAYSLGILTGILVMFLMGLPAYAILGGTIISLVVCIFLSLGKIL